MKTRWKELCSEFLGMAAVLCTAGWQADTRKLREEEGK